MMPGLGIKLGVPCDVQDAHVLLHTSVSIFCCIVCLVDVLDSSQWQDAIVMNLFLSSFK